MAVAGDGLAPAVEILEQGAEAIAELALQGAGTDEALGGGGERDFLCAGGVVHGAKGHLADTASGDVDDALEGEVVRGLVQDAHVGDGVADFRRVRRSGGHR